MIRKELEISSPEDTSGELRTMSGAISGYLRRGIAGAVVGATLLAQPLAAVAAPGGLDTAFGPGPCLPTYPGFTSLSFNGPAGSCPDDQVMAVSGSARALLWQSAFGSGQETGEGASSEIIVGGSIELGLDMQTGDVQTAFTSVDLNGNLVTEFGDGAGTLRDGKMTDISGEVVDLLGRDDGAGKRDFIALVEIGGGSGFEMAKFTQDGSNNYPHYVGPYVASNGVAGMADVDGSDFVVVATDHDASGKGEILVRRFDSIFGLVPVTATGSYEYRIGNGALSSTGRSYNASSLFVDQASGSLYVGGSVNYTFTSMHVLHIDPVVFKVDLATGALDTTFGAGGMVVLSVGGVYGTIDSINQLSDGTLVVGGNTQAPSMTFGSLLNSMAVATLDSTSGALVNSRQISLPNGQLEAIAVDSADRVVVAGSADGPTAQQSPAVAVARLLPDLSMDALFGVGGVTVVPASDHQSRALDVMVDPVMEDIYVAVEADFPGFMGTQYPHLTVGRFFGGPLLWQCMVSNQ